MMYQYNFSFLAQWMEANRNIPKGAIQQAIGARSNNGLKSWIRGEGPMPIISMLRFCNTFQIPISAFFRDNDADGTEHMIKPNGKEQLEPNGGFATSTDDRARGERSLLNPLDVNITPSIIPGMMSQERTNQQKETQNTVSMQTTAQKVDTVVGNFDNASLSTFMELESKHRAQQDKLLNIISEQQKQIVDLTRLLMEKSQTRPYSNITNNDYPTMAAEPNVSR